MEKTIKETRGTVGERHTLTRTNDEEIAYINALKAVDFEKEYQAALRDIAEAMFDMEFDDENNEVNVEPLNEEHNG